MESQSAVTHVAHDTNTKARATTLRDRWLKQPSLIMAVTTLTYRSRDISKKRVSRGGPNTDCGEKLELN